MSEGVGWFSRSPRSLSSSAKLVDSTSKNEITLLAREAASRCYLIASHWAAAHLLQAMCDTAPFTNRADKQIERRQDKA